LSKKIEQAWTQADEAYERGDYAAAIAILRPLAEGGDMWARSNLAHLYESGRGVEPDIAGAARWYRKAAEQGCATAQNYLGTLYEDGLAVEQDYEAAARWYRLAAEQEDASGSTISVKCMMKVWASS
jgi:TPR repeat protein